MRIVFIFNLRAICAAACLSRWKQSWVFNFAEQTPRGGLSSAARPVSISACFSLFCFLLGAGLGFDSAQEVKCCRCGFLLRLDFVVFLGWFFFFPGCCFHGSFGCQPSLMTLHRQRKQRAGVLHSVNQTHLDHRHLHATAVPSTQKIHTDKLGTIWNFAAMRLLF